MLVISADYQDGQPRIIDPLMIARSDNSRPMIVLGDRSRHVWVLKTNGPRVHAISSPVCRNETSLSPNGSDQMQVCRS